MLELTISMVTALLGLSYPLFIDLTIVQFAQGTHLDICYYIP